MDRGSWWATVRGGHKEWNMTEVTAHMDVLPWLCISASCWSIKSILSYVYLNMYKSSNPNLKIT